MACGAQLLDESARGEEHPFYALKWERERGQSAYGLWFVLYKRFVSFRSFFAHINNILCKHPLCLGTPSAPFIAHTIAQYLVSTRPPFTEVYTIQYWWWQYHVKDNLRCPDFGRKCEPRRTFLRCPERMEKENNETNQLRAWGNWANSSYTKTTTGAGGLIVPRRTFLPCPKK